MEIFSKHISQNVNLHVPLKILNFLNWLNVRRTVMLLNAGSPECINSIFLVQLHALTWVNVPKQLLRAGADWLPLGPLESRMLLSVWRGLWCLSVSSRQNSHKTCCGPFVSSRILFRRILLGLCKSLGVRKMSLETSSNPSGCARSHLISEWHAVGLGNVMTGSTSSLALSRCSKLYYERY